MMIRMSDKDCKLSQSIAGWYAFDKNGNYVLREDAPPEVRKIHEMLKEKYSWIES
uniref:hypothetical protein n=1 Tax=Gemmiger qucibialis TaxID=2997294 RepID=UPI003FF0145C